MARAAITHIVALLVWLGLGSTVRLRFSCAIGAI